MKIISGFDVLKENKVKNPIAIIVNDELRDLSTTFSACDTAEIVDINHPLAIDVIRHSAAHLMAQAVTELYPHCKVAIGPVIENGFYYDFDCDHKFSEDDFSKIESRMLEIKKKNEKIERSEISKLEAENIFKEEPYKLEIIKSIESDSVSIYRQGNFVDLCRGPHAPSTSCIPKSFKLQRVAGAYWCGDSKNKMLQRIYAVAYKTKEELQEHLEFLVEVEKRDHRKIAKDMDLFHIQEEAAGSIFWHQKGWTLYKILRNYISEKTKEDGYMEVLTPQMIDKSLWEASGHWEKFRTNMFIAESEDRTLAIKPMNCPGHIQIYNQGIKSYRDLPYRLSEFGCCHRNEPSGALYGCMRVRGFTQDDGHILCTVDQINSETKKFCNLLREVYKDLGFDSFNVKFSDRPDVRAGSDEVWDKAEELLKSATSEAGLSFTINKGEGAFYGPKLEFILKDKLGRDWQCGTLQVDFVLPERLNAWYIGEDGKKHHPVMIHRAILGSMERFIGILLENYAGWLPLWLSPVQIVVATITNQCDEYALRLLNLLKDNDIRAEIDIRAEKISYKIREHVCAKIPMIIIVGENEAKNNMVTVRYPDGRQDNVSLSELMSYLNNKGISK